MLPPTAASIVLALALAAPAVQDAPPPEVARLVEQIQRQGDDADPVLVEELALLGTREAMQALVRLEDSVGSPALRLEIVVALARFDGVAGVEREARPAGAPAATSSPEPEVREAALDALAASPSLGKHFLRQIVDSPALDAVRVGAMERYVALGDEQDHAWYEELLAAPALKPAKRAAEDGPRAHSLEAVRALAFEALAPSLKSARLIEAARDKERDDADYRRERVRELALRELERRGDRGAAKVAEKAFEDVTESPSVRAVAARVLAQLGGKRELEELLDAGLADPSVTPTELRVALVELVAARVDPKLERKLLAELRSAKGPARAFLLRVLGGAAPGEKVDEALLEELAAEEELVRVAAVETLAARGVAAAVGPLEQLLKSATSTRLASTALAALAQLRAGDPAWEGELVALTDSPVREVRNAALKQLSADAAAHVPLFERALAHADWSTRFQALKGLEAARTPAAIGALVARMDDETGLMRDRVARALFRLTGQPFRAKPEAWQAWWAESAAGFAPIGADELARLEREEQRRRLQQSSTTTKFFGIPIESHRLVFVLDVSGSMSEPMRGESVGETGEERMAVAKRELIAAVDGLDTAALFDIVVFSSGAESWLDGGLVAADADGRARARGFVERLTPGGGTNLFGGLQLALASPDVDTVVVLSDGDPSVGAVVDPFSIRRVVAEQNEHRGVLIHTVAIGGDLDVLRWLAEDSGGAHVAFQ